MKNMYRAFVSSTAAVVASDDIGNGAIGGLDEEATGDHDRDRDRRPPDGDDDADRGDHDRCRRCNDDDDCRNLERDRCNGGEEDDGGLPEPVVLVINVSL